MYACTTDMIHALCVVGDLCLVTCVWCLIEVHKCDGSYSLTQLGSSLHITKHSPSHDTAHVGIKRNWPTNADST